MKTEYNSCQGDCQRFIQVLAEIANPPLCFDLKEMDCTEFVNLIPF